MSETVNTNKFKIGRKKDNVRNYYVCKNNKLQCSFEDCKKVFSLKTSVIVLKHHTYEIHNYIKDDTSHDNVRMTPHDDAEIVLYQNFAIAFAKNSLPHSLIEDYYFRKAVNCVNSNTLTKSKLREFIISEGSKINRDIIENHRLNRQPITIALDGWTNIRMNKVTNILLICSGISYYFTSIENKFSANTAENLIPILSEKIKFLANKGLRVIALTTYNENLMKLTRQQLNILHPILLIIPCSAHIIQLCFKSICQIDVIKNVIEETTALIKSIHNNKANRIRLLELQKNDNVIDQLKVIYPTEIRWTSLILCIERLHTLKKNISQLSVNISNEYWTNLDKLHKLLKPFKDTINKIQKDDASLYSVWTCFNAIMKFYKSLDITDFLKTKTST